MLAAKTRSALFGAAVLGVSAYALVRGDQNVLMDNTGSPQPAVPAASVYHAELAPPSDEPVKEFRIPVSHATVRIADGVAYEAWMYGGTVPGPTIRVREGDRVRIHLVNEAPIPHSIDFHAARIPWNEAYRSIDPGEELTFEFTARDPGAYLVHCGTTPVTMHIMQGLYLPIIVDPKEGWGTEADKEFVLVESEFYVRHNEDGSSGQPDWNAALEKKASYVVFNGRAFQYKAHPLNVAVGDRVRFFVVNAGPSLTSEFHIVGAVFNRVYPDGNPAHALESVQTWSVPPGGGAVFETVFEEGGSGEGWYPFVSHAFADAEKGAVGLIQVGAPRPLSGGRAERSRSLP